MKTKYHLKPNELAEEVSPAAMGLEFTSVQRLEFNDNEKQLATQLNEVCHVVLSGEIDYEIADTTGRAKFKDMLYVPRGTSITLRSEGAAVVMSHKAPAHRDTAFAHLTFSEIDGNPKRHAVYGKRENNSRRDVWHYLDDEFDACRLMMGICQGDTGGWTVWPPHEHGAEREEVYTYFDMNPSFAIQCVYEDMDEPLVVAMVRDGHLVSIPKGYHPNVGCPAGRISFVYCMVAKTAGEREFMNLRIQEIYGDKFE